MNKSKGKKTHWNSTVWRCFRRLWFPNSPAIFPRAQTACSLIWWWGDVIRPMKAGMAPPSTTAVVWSDVPDAMLVRAQAASNWIGGDWDMPRKPTNLGIRPALMIRSMGGCLSLDSSFLNTQRDTIRKAREPGWRRGNAFSTNYELANLAAWVACTWVSRLLLLTPLTISSTVQCWACHENRMRVYTLLLGGFTESQLLYDLTSNLQLLSKLIRKWGSEKHSGAVVTLLYLMIYYNCWVINLNLERSLAAKEKQTKTKTL